MTIKSNRIEDTTFFFLLVLISLTTVWVTAPLV